MRLKTSKEDFWFFTFSVSRLQQHNSAYMPLLYYYYYFVFSIVIIIYIIKIGFGIMQKNILRHLLICNMLHLSFIYLICKILYKDSQFTLSKKGLTSPSEVTPLTLCTTWFDLLIDLLPTPTTIMIKKLMITNGMVQSAKMEPYNLNVIVDLKIQF